jgi:signal transduction histidine kinase
MEIQPILHDVYTTVLPQAKKKGVELVLDVARESCELNADPERLRQVFINLVDNALKFTPTGGTVTVASRVIEDPASGDRAGLALLAPTESQVRVWIKDTGIGIPRYEHAKIFDAFYQVDSSTRRGYGGTGLGLSIVRRLVLAHGGTITVEKNEPEGTVFVVTVPSASHPMTQTSLPPPPVGLG